MVSCKDCHFLAKYYVCPFTGKQEGSIPWNQSERADLITERTFYHIQCFEGAWQVKTRDDDEDIKLEITKNRKCKFYQEYKAGMSLEAGAKLFQIENTERQRKRANRSTLINVCIGVAGIAIGVIGRDSIISVLDILVNWLVNLSSG